MKNQIAKTWIEIAMLTNKQLTQQMVEVLLENVSDLPQAEVLNVLSKWLESERSFPMPADIREKIKPELSHDDNANEVASLIISCVSKFGRTNQDEAKNKMGELACEVVRTMGGWKHICETMTLENENTFRAQARELARAISKKSLRGELGEAPTLPKSDLILNLASNALKPI